LRENANRSSHRPLGWNSPPATRTNSFAPARKKMFDDHAFPLAVAAVNPGVWASFQMSFQGDLCFKID
jgi:hypothetical protein